MSQKLMEIIANPHNKVLFVGIGNVLKRDDGAGVYISRNIKNNGNISSISVEVSVENYIGKINNKNPDILVLIDCVAMNSKPGTYQLLTLNDINDLTFNTHNISLKKLKDFFPMPVFILGIQPESVEFGETMSPSVKKAVQQITKLINKEA